jgi:hypothetical protein
MNEIAIQRTIVDMVEEYAAKDAALTGEVEAFAAAVQRAQFATTVGGVYGGDIWGRASPSVDARAARRVLLVSAWKAVYSRLQIDRIATARDKALWERTIADPPPLTIENARATFGDYLLRTRFHLLRGLAEVFVELDEAYRSHSKVKIGVRGMPKRLILRSVGSFGSYGRDKVLAVLNALAAYRGEPLVEHAELRDLDALHNVWGHQAGEVRFDARTVKTLRGGREEDAHWPRRGVWIRKFQNGNAHLFFEPDTLIEINRALAEFYGDVLPDCPEAEPERLRSTAVARDLQFYPTPEAVIDVVLAEVGIDKPSRYERDDRPRYRVLEPSCGDGRILDAIRNRHHAALGIEVDSGRAAAARAKGHAVQTANFLETPATPDFDRVVMNPPFYGRHYVEHVRHALGFLRPGGLLIAILPASAHYDHRDLLPKGSWTDLPVASFAESGTNVPTGYLVIRRPE